MVFTTALNLVRVRGPDEFWRKRRVFKLAAHYYGRSRNCYSLSIRAVHHALTYATVGRRQKRKDMTELWIERITGGARQHGLDYSTFQENLVRNNILLNRKSLADLACWEPRTFEALARIAAETPEGLVPKE